MKSKWLFIGIIYTNGILINFIKGRNTTICDNVDESVEYYAK